MVTCRFTCSELLRRLAVALVLTALPLAANAQQVIKLTAMDGYPERALWVKEFIEFYMPEVDKRLAKDNKYKIEWQKAFGGQIVKPRGEFDGVKNGLGDIAIITTVFYEDKLPLNNVPYFTPFSSSNPKIVAKIIDDLGDKFPEFHKQFTDYNQVVLTSFSTIDDYGIFASKPIAKLDDLKGMKLDAAGPNALYIKSVGAVGVSGSLVSYYNDIKTGIADGAIAWMEAAVTFKIGEVAPHHLKTDFGTGVNKAITVNLDVWKKLPDDVKKVLKEVAILYRDHVAQVTLDIADKSTKAFTAKGGKIVALTAAEKRAWAMGLPNIAKSWADDVEKRGYPGNKFLVAYMDALRAAGEKPVRNWDKE
ncbi:MAG: C4-dicarboxylate TRAP transporter substrate-binding protein [Pseudolabrys sp.]